MGGYLSLNFILSGMASPKNRVNIRVVFTFHVNTTEACIPANHIYQIIEQLRECPIYTFVMFIFGFIYFPTHVHGLGPSLVWSSAVVDFQHGMHGDGQDVPVPFSLVWCSCRKQPDLVVILDSVAFHSPFLLGCVVVWPCFGLLPPGGLLPIDDNQIDSYMFHFFF